MGSYLTVVNETNNVWKCKVGPDMETAMIAALVIGAVAAVAGIVASGGGAAGAITAMVAGVTKTTIFGISVSALTTTATALSGMTAAATAATGMTAGAIGIASGVTAFAAGTIKLVTNKLDEKGYDTIEAGDRKRYGKMTLSLWQQSECVRTIADGNSVNVDHLYMRPIFSGSTNKSNRDHNIQWWLDKHGTSREVIEGTSKQIPKNAKRLLESEEEIVYFL